MKEVRYCTECVWSEPEPRSEWNLRCKNPSVNAKDPWALSAKEIHGSSCRDEREVRFFAVCGMKGKLWKAK